MVVGTVCTQCSGQWMALWQRFNEHTGVEYIAPFQVGAPICSSAIGYVRYSSLKQFKKGDLVMPKALLLHPNADLLSPPFSFFSSDQAK